MEILAAMPGVNQAVIVSAIVNQRGALVPIRPIINAAEHIEPEQREALLGAVAEVLSGWHLEPPRLTGLTSPPESF